MASLNLRSLTNPNTFRRISPKLYPAALGGRDNRGTEVFHEPVKTVLFKQLIGTCLAS